MSAAPEDAFWEFSLRTYARAGVAPACLGLQDRRGADVNLLLYCCWIAAAGRGALERDALERLVALTRAWQDTVIAPLRAVRRRLKGETLAAVPADRREGLRDDLKRVELEAERIEHALLAAAPLPGRVGAAAPRDPRAAAKASLERYFAVLGVVLDDADRADLARLVEAGLEEGA